MSLEKEISAGESRTLEYKAELPEETHKWMKTIVAFANGAGGKFIVGVDNKREVVGLKPSEDIFSLKDKIADAIAQTCEPQVMFDIYQESVKNRVVAVVEVFPGNYTPYHLKKFGVENGTFIRLGATTRKADENTIFELNLKKNRRYFDELPYTDLQVTPKDMRYLCRDFSKRSGKRITEEFLFNTHLVKKEGKNLIATNAYSIFLGKRDFFCKIQCARFKGTERVLFTDKKDFEGPLLEQIDGAYKFVLDHIDVNVKIEGLYRKESYELPEKAIRELILNAVIHRNYMMSSCIQVAVYDDRVEISSPGALYGSLTLQEALSGRSSIRNKVIATVCEKLGIVEGWGTGLKRIVDLCKECKIKPPEFLEIGDLLRVNFYRVKKADSLNDRINDSLNDSLNKDSSDSLNLTDIEKKIVKIMLNDPEINVSQLVEQTNVSEPTINRHIKVLKEKGTVIRVGSKKTGVWKISSETSELLSKESK